MIYEIAAVALIALLVWRAGRRWPMAESNRSKRWRFVPLATALAVLVVSFATFGAGLLLAPIAALMTVLGRPRLSSPRGSAYWLGATLSVVLMVGFGSVIAIVIYDMLTASS